MDPKNSSPKRYWYGLYEGNEIRCQRRLQKDLGIDKAAVEAIIRLRRQVIELQAHIRQLESKQAAQAANQQLRLTRYREVFYEATWIEEEFQE